MLSELHLKNFRGFADHTINFRELSVVVGSNNAGKSTIVEALRFVSIVTTRYKGLRFQRPAQLFEEYGAHTGVSPSIKNLAFNFDHLFHRYGDPPAIITATFNDRSKVQVFIGENQDLFACIFDQQGAAIRTQANARTIQIPRIDIMPQIGPVRREEEELSQDYVKGAASSGLSSLHFRNHFQIFPGLWDEVQKAVHQTWPGVHLQEMLIAGEFPPRKLHLAVRNEDFVAEIGLMGHGLQMWLQTLSFLCRAAGSHTVILDEPDVYMHADMQRRLVRYIRGRFPQTILTTHSVEIMAEVEPEDIIIVDRRRSVSNYSSSAPAVQRLIERMGSVQNLQLARLWNARRLIMVEGKDIKFLKIIQDLIFPGSGTPIDSIPNMTIGGWGGWSYAIGSSMLMKNAIGESIQSYCIFDRDFHPMQVIESRYEEAYKKGVSLHIWSKKEIENFVVNSVLIYSFVREQICGKTSPPTLDQINAKIEEYADELEDTVFDAFSTEYLNLDRSEGIANANKSARAMIRKHREAAGSIRDLVHRPKNKCAFGIISANGEAWPELSFHSFSQ